MIVITWKRSNLCSNLCTQLQSNYFKELSCNTTVAIGESPSDKCEKLHTVATSNNRDNTSCSLDYCLFAPRIYGCYSSLVVNRTFNATPTERLQQHPLLFTTKHTDRTFFLWRFSHSTTFTSWSQHHFVAIGKPEPRVRKASHCGSKQQQRSHAMITLRVR